MDVDELIIYHCIDYQLSDVFVNVYVGAII